jgi:hypothetical protein
MLQIFTDAMLIATGQYQSLRRKWDHKCPEESQDFTRQRGKRAAHRDER